MRKILLEIAGITVGIELDEAFASLKLPRAYAPFTMPDARAVRPYTPSSANSQDAGISDAANFRKAGISDAANFPNAGISDAANFQEAGISDAAVFLKVCRGSAPFSPAGLQPVATGCNDLGEARLYEKNGVYVVALSPLAGEDFRLMLLDNDFCSATLWLAHGDRHASFVIDSMLRILFAQAAVSRNALLVHASSVICQGRAYLFMGKSGTGKSTHSSLWKNTFEGVTLLNDDNPVIRLMPDGEVRVFGSPWSGKTPCWRQASAPLQGIARLEQSPQNEFIPLTDVDAFMAILPGVSVITSHRLLYNRAASIVEELTRRLRIGQLRCRPDRAAARLSFNSLCAG